MFAFAHSNIAWPTTPVPDPNWPYPPDEIAERKEAFARAFLRRPNDAFGAALEIEKQTTKALWIDQYWRTDPEVLAFMGDIRGSEGAAAELPTKEQFALDLYERGRDLADKELALDYWKLFAKVMGYDTSETPIGGMTVNNNTVVLYAPIEEPLDDWERKTIEHQKALIDAAD